MLLSQVIVRLFSMATGSSHSFWPIGHPSEEMPGNRFPSKDQALLYLMDVHSSKSATKAEAARKCLFKGGKGRKTFRQSHQLANRHLFENNQNPELTAAWDRAMLFHGTVCRHHIIEVIFSNVFTKCYGPDVPLFKRFQSHRGFLDY